MRNLRTILSLMALSLLACACLPDVEFPVQSQENLLTATIGGDPATKTSLSTEEDNYSKVLWSKGDQIGVFVNGEPNLYTYTLVSGAGRSEAVFSGFGTGASYIAVYPCTAVTGLNGETVSIDLPSEQTHVQGSFGNGSNPMVAVSNTTDLPFRNLCAVLKVSMTGHHYVTSLVFRPNDENVKVAGPATISLADPDHPVLTVSNQGCDSLMLNTGGVMLDDETPTDFYLVLPAQTYKGGFTVRVNTNTGYMDKKLNTDITLERARKYDARPFVVKLDVGVEPSSVLEGSGTETDPFRIASLGDLLLMQGAVNAAGTIKSINGGVVAANSAYYLLTDDIDLSPVCGAASGKSWTPIGNLYESDENKFFGYFDGRGHRVYNLYVKWKTPGSGVIPTTYVGLFGQSKRGEIKNLTVDGAIDAEYSFAGLIAGLADRVSDCIAEGSIAATGGGGIVGVTDNSEGAFISHCINRASISVPYSEAGGITGRCWTVYITDCINEGDVSASRSWGGGIGGIIGYLNAGGVYNCTNKGAISGCSFIGGLVGEALQASQIYNCLNTGEIIGRDLVGGICGYLNATNALWQNKLTTLANCLNVGTVTHPESDEAVPGPFGALVGFSGINQESWYLPEEYYYALVKNSWWLYDEASGKGMKEGVGTSTGQVINIAPLTLSQLAGVQDDLNAGACDLKTELSEPLAGWELDEEKGYPVLTDLPAQKPGNESAVFLVSPESLEVLALGGKVQVNVTSSLDYQLGNLPDWIQEETVQTYETQPHSKTHSFKILANDGEEARAGAICFVNAEGTTKQVVVNQTAPYLTVSESPVMFTEFGGTVRVVVLSSIKWQAFADADWLTAEPAAGEGDGTVSLRAAGNETAFARGASVTVRSADGTLIRTIPIVQSGKNESDSGDWKTRPFYHQSLAMRFTATWCGWCPRMSRSISRAQELYPDKIIHLAIHGDGSKLDFVAEPPLHVQYHITGRPSGIVDGRVAVSNTEVEVASAVFVNAVKETEEVYGTSSGAAIRSSVFNQAVTVNVDAYFKTAGDYKITVLLLEDSIIEEQEDYENGHHEQYVHNHIARVALTDVLGDAFAISEDLSQKHFNYSATVPSNYDVSNMRVLVYIQKAFGSAPRIQSGNYGDYYVDNCAVVKLGDDLPLVLEGGGGGSSGGDGGGNEDIIPGSEIK